MRTSSARRSLIAGLLVTLALQACHSSAQSADPKQQAQSAQPSWSAVDQALGRPGTTQPDGVRR